jgi:hypothetical protein
LLLFGSVLLRWRPTIHHRPNGSGHNDPGEIQADRPSKTAAVAQRIQFFIYSPQADQRVAASSSVELKES